MQNRNSLLESHIGTPSTEVEYAERFNLNFREVFTTQQLLTTQ